MRVEITPTDWSHAETLAGAAACAAAEHGLDARLDVLHLVLDALAPEEHPWIERPASRVLALYLHPDQFLLDRAAGLVAGPTARPWELRRREAGAEAPAFSLPNAERTLHHALLGVADLLEGRIRPAELGRDEAEAFQEAWDVTLDGRLRRRSLPGLPVADRRRRFFRVFSGGGCLLPRHWEIFHQLWEDDDPRHETIAELARALPPAGGANRN